MWRLCDKIILLYDKTILYVGKYNSPHKIEYKFADYNQLNIDKYNMLAYCYTINTFIYYLT